MTTKRVQEAFEAIKSEVTSDNCQFFNSRNTVGDEMETIYEKDGITIDICYDWGYFEVFGMTNEEFIDFKRLFGINNPEQSGIIPTMADIFG